MQIGSRITLKIKAGRYVVPLTITKEMDKKLWLEYEFNRDLNALIKNNLDGEKWHGYEDNPRKQWSVKDSEHTWWQLRQLQHLAAPKSCISPYAHYDEPLKLLKLEDIQFPDWKFPLTLTDGRVVTPYDYQYEGFSAIVQYKMLILAYEMGLGKSLMTMIGARLAQERQNFPLTILWVAPNSAIISVQLEVRKWKFPLKIDFIPISQLVKFLAEWPSGKRIHQFIAFDESSRYKSQTAKRSQAAQTVADAVRREWGDDGYVVELTGSPAPKSPLDWFSQCSIARPGFLKESNIHKFKARLAFTAKEEGAAGGTYTKLLNWKDNPELCSVCGLLKSNSLHDPIYRQQPNYPPDYHEWVPSVNEVAKLKDRTRGLVHVKFKKDCLSLPDMIYKEAVAEPTRETLRAAEIIMARSTSTIVALTELRELSDGFLYTNEIIGEHACDLCGGKCSIVQPVFDGPDQIPDGKEDDGWTPIEYYYPIQDYPQYWRTAEVACPTCSGRGKVNTLRRHAKQLECPKEDLLVDILEEYDDTGRIVIYGGFTGSIERCIQIAKRQDWEVITVVEGVWGNSLGIADRLNALEVFQGRVDNKIAFIGHPGSAGMGLTLTASKAIAYYSNDFNGESRIQSEARIHRAGMDTNVAPSIWDLIHLPTDRLVIKNLKQKRDLQHLTLTKEYLYARE